MTTTKTDRSIVHNFTHSVNVAKRYNLRLARQSVRMRILRAIRPWSLQPYLNLISEAAIEEIRGRCFQAEDGELQVGWKYLDFRKYLPLNLQRVEELDLDKLPTQRILDIGSGAGYFLFMCNHLGHNCLGFDTGDVSAYNEMMKLFKIPRITGRIEPFVPLPDLGAPFDLITAYQIVFNRSKPSGVWRTAEWDFFLRDLVKHVKPDGRIFLRLNYQGKTCYITEELAKFFHAMGGDVRRTSVRFDLKNGKFKTTG